MSKHPLSLTVGDVSALARTIRRTLDENGRVPGHVEMLNLLARSGGFRNFQHLKAVRDAEHVPAPTPAADTLNLKRVTKAVGYFDVEGRLIRWPKKESLRFLCLWVLWSRMPARQGMSELEIDERLMLDHLFCDHTMLRRFMVDYQLLERTPDGREYRRVEQEPPLEALEVIRRVSVN